MAVLLAFGAAPARAKPCGDAVDGRDVPCACGDTVVSDVVLADDPVTTTVCDGDALVVHVPAGVPGVRLDLGGRTLRGRGRGVGVWIVRGGVGGAHLLGGGAPAVIQGFRDGVVAHGDAAALIERIVARDNARDGFRLIDAGAVTVRAATAIGSGRDGFWISGRGFTLSGTHAIDSARHGYRVTGAEGTLGADAFGGGMLSERSGGAGLRLLGHHHRLSGIAVSGSAGDGLSVQGDDILLSGVAASRNAGTGIAGRGGRWRVAASRAFDNDGAGLVIEGPAMADDGGNGGSGNGGEGAPAGAMQCQIGGQPCRP